ncbi:MAG TPA: helicase-related protein, partial [Fimbriimonas sp.]|nr:helicase-related protein [Fimbriimonas sp.]
GDGDNKFVVLSCPWCGIDMGPQPYRGRVQVFGYERSSGPAQVRFRCEDRACPFSGSPGLPLEVVDERIYDQPPTLVVGTVDKFAMLPWEPKAKSLFAIDNPDISPPDLIIQDELHLISGPLGSMVGHYETVIDELSSRGAPPDRVGPKVIASTATIAHASEQVRAVYSRPAVLFPPQGLRAGESFFAVEREDLPGRMYVGVLATALPSHVTAQVRVISALLQSVALLQPPWTDDPVPTAARDPYWTLMVYFNSLRELGRAATLIQADIREYLSAVWDRIGLTPLIDLYGEAGKRLRRFIDRPEELTSRVRSSDIPVILQKLFSRLESGEAIDLCLATNMIQVGLDVPRLSLMTIIGQPKTASEYIQASSRVGRGRDTPGLVVTNYNPFKPRDRSHFETFRQYHASIYRHVEPTSVTPFSIPVSERAIHALAVTIARYSFAHLRDSPALGLSDEEVEHIARVVLDRVRAVSPGEETSANLTLRRFLADWNRARPQYYGSFSQTIPGDVEPLLWPAGKPMDRTWTLARSTPSSMRNVDAECEARPVRAYAEPEA